jgi:nitrogen fixation/metabolism regulation signal transduction histidine kinase
VLALGVLLARKLWQLYATFRDHVPGSRLTARTVGMFGALVVAPLLIVYLFSLEFLNRGIDSWFRVEIKQGLNDALVLSRSALDLRVREQSRRTENFARSMRELQGPDLLVRLDEERRATRGQGHHGLRCARARAVSSASAGAAAARAAAAGWCAADGRGPQLRQPAAADRRPATRSSPPRRSPRGRARRRTLRADQLRSAAGAVGARRGVQHAYSQYGDCRRCASR